MSEDSAVDFPLRLGAIDVGSNAIRFIAAEFVSPGNRIVLDEQRVPVRLGTGAFTTGSLAPDAIEAAARTFVGFRRSIDLLGLPHVRAVATSAVRESANGPALIERVRAESGIQIETISGSEEARLVWLAVTDRLPASEGGSLLVDLGGGSLEVSLFTPEGIDWTESHMLGTVRILEDVRGGNLAPTELAELVREYVGALRFREALKAPPARVAITGGNAEALAQLADAPRDASGVATMTRVQLGALVERLSSLSVEERVSQLGLHPDRADVILPAALVYDRVTELSGLDRVLVPSVGVKDGVLLDLVDDLREHAVHVGRIEAQIYRAAIAVGRRYHFDEPHARQVTRLALSLFDQIGDLHELGEQDRRVLLAASLLHDIGQFIAHRKHHKHAQYLILHSELPNLTEAQLRICALTARYHRGSEPRDDHELYSDLSGKDRRRVRRMAAILRVATALDKEYAQRVSGAKVTRAGDEVLLHVEGTGQLLLERWALTRKSRMFENEFNVRLRTVDPEGGVGI